MSGELPWPFDEGGSESQSLSAADPGFGSWEKGRGNYSATQVGNVVELTAWGTLPNMNMEAKLVQSQIAIFPPHFALLFLMPSIALPATKPFQVSTSFAAENPVTELQVHDADGTHRVPVNPLKI